MPTTNLKQTQMGLNPDLCDEMPCLKIHTLISYHYLSNNLTYSLLYWYSNNKTHKIIFPSYFIYKMTNLNTKKMTSY
jgi:hypothetical protein